ncbi:unnamed protein product [Tilletia caries]|uniref:non-specific serine/threonine protein kinase n=1 Tax=Tilletia caries TaxID=13290 RepID=A0ABN7IJR4_9BASI|nr:unnamed protein product [Tilletia caries]
MSPASTQQFRNLVGTNIANDKYELLSVLGLGAYGVVYLARDREHALQRQPFPSTSAQQNIPAMQMAHQFGSAASGLYAVKCLNKVGLDERQREFQRREIELHTQASKHKNIVTLHQVIDSPNDPYIFVVLDYCPDGDLFSMITERQRYLVAAPPAPRRTANGSITRWTQEEEDFQQRRSEMDLLIKSVFDQILDAVEYCHQNQIYHRDLKPENILCLDGGRRVVLADFGLATQEPSSSDFGCGSTFYMGPECQGGLLRRISKYSTPANDVWSLGVILVNLVCGRNPWKQACVSDETFLEYVRNPQFLMDILPISEDTNAILRHIFTMRPEDRCSVAQLRKWIRSVGSFTATPSEMKRRQEQSKLRASQARQQQAEAQAQAQAQAEAEAQAKAQALAEAQAKARAQAQAEAHAQAQALLWAEAKARAQQQQQQQQQAATRPHRSTDVEVDGDDEFSDESDQSSSSRDISPTHSDCSYDAPQSPTLVGSPRPAASSVAFTFNEEEDGDCTLSSPSQQLLHGGKRSLIASVRPASVRRPILSDTSYSSGSSGSGSGSDDDEDEEEHERRVRDGDDSPMSDDDEEYLDAGMTSDSGSSSSRSAGSAGSSRRGSEFDDAIRTPDIFPHHEPAVVVYEAAAVSRPHLLVEAALSKSSIPARHHYNIHHAQQQQLQATTVIAIGDRH